MLYLCDKIHRAPITLKTLSSSSLTARAPLLTLPEAERLDIGVGSFLTGCCKSRANVAHLGQEEGGQDELEDIHEADMELDADLEWRARVGTMMTHSRTPSETSQKRTWSTVANATGTRMTINWTSLRMVIVMTTANLLGQRTINRWPQMAVPRTARTCTKMICTLRLVLCRNILTILVLR